MRLRRKAQLKIKGERLRPDGREVGISLENRSCGRRRDTRGIGRQLTRRPSIRHCGRGVAVLPCVLRRVVECLLIKNQVLRDPDSEVFIHFGRSQRHIARQQTVVIFSKNANCTDVFGIRPNVGFGSNLELIAAIDLGNVPGGIALNPKPSDDKYSYIV